MSDLPVLSQHFSGGARLTAADRSEGAPLYSLLNAAAFSAESVVAMSGAVNLSTADAATVAAANRRIVTNSGAARTFTLPTFADAPDYWEQTFISLDAGTNELTISTAATINGVATGVIVLTTASHEWVKVMKIPGASGWIAIGGTLVTPT
jgi:hypothetical protein